MNGEKLLMIALGQAILYLLIWLVSDYIGLLLCLGVSLISFSILVISWIADRLEYAGVPSWYYPLMIMSTLIPMLIIALFWFFKSGEMDWMKNPF